jgi:EF-P beta-lysylation protein EpmB
VESVPLWRKIQRKNFTRLQELLDFLEIDADKQELLLSSPSFPLNLPLRLAEKIAKNNLEDPLFRQFVPLAEELKETSGYKLDPVADLTFRKKNKLLHKYKGRALLVCTGACVMNCRFCFRKNFDYKSGESSFEEEMEAIKNDPTLTEIILSGGDPLSLSDEVLCDLFDQLSGISHVQRLRFHTRFPLGIPERINETFLEMLASCRMQVIFVLHSNHARELDEAVLASLKRIQKLGIPVLNQSVLLKGVNDSQEALLELCNLLINQGILPYYVHQLDRVQGSGHFEVDEERGLELMQEIALQLPGYGVPKYVKEIPGEGSKSFI